MLMAFSCRFFPCFSVRLLDIIFCTAEEDFGEDGSGRVPDAEKEVECGEVGTAPLRAPQPQHADITAFDEKVGESENRNFHKVLGKGHHDKFG